MNKIFTLIFMFFTTLLFAQDAAPKKGAGYMQSLIMILLAVVFFYFILWRPERKRRKLAQMQRESLKVGDRITAMGIIGTVDRVEKDTIILKMFDGSKIEMLKAAVTDVKSKEEPAQSMSKEEKK